MKIKTKINKIKLLRLLIFFYSFNLFFQSSNLQNKVNQFFFRYGSMKMRQGPGSHWEPWAPFQSGDRPK